MMGTQLLSTDERKVRDHLPHRVVLRTKQGIICKVPNTKWGIVIYYGIIVESLIIDILNQKVVRSD